jgi:serine/threonine protein kinase
MAQRWTFGVWVSWLLVRSLLSCLTGVPTSVPIRILFLEMIEGEPPYLSEKPTKAYILVAMNGTPTIRDSERLSDVFKDYLAKCLEVDVDKRLDAQQLLKVRSYSFVCLVGY